MKVTDTALPGVKLVEPKVFGDQRGFFYESYHADRYAAAGIDETFVQDNVSFSRGAVLRGLHLQHPHGQAKLVGVLEGKIFDVAVDVRAGSETFGQWVGVELSADNKKQLFIPKGFAHGFCTLSETVLFSYKCSDYYMPENETAIAWNDPEIGIKWPQGDPVLSQKDSAGISLSQYKASL